MNRLVAAATLCSLLGAQPGIKNDIGQPSNNTSIAQALNNENIDQLVRHIKDNGVKFSQGECICYKIEYPLNGNSRLNGREFDNMSVVYFEVPDSTRHIGIIAYKIQLLRFNVRSVFLIDSEVNGTKLDGVSDLALEKSFKLWEASRQRGKAESGPCTYGANIRKEAGKANISHQGIYDSALGHILKEKDYVANEH